MANRFSEQEIQQSFHPINSHVMVGSKERDKAEKARILYFEHSLSLEDILTNLFGGSNDDMRVERLKAQRFNNAIPASFRPANIDEADLIEMKNRTRLRWLKSILNIED